MTTVPQVRGSAYLPFLSYMERVGTSVKRNLEAELVVSVVYEKPEALVPVHSAHSFLERCARLAGIPDLGYAVAEDARVEQLGAFGRSLTRSMTLHDTLCKLRAVFPLYSSAERIWWQFAGDQVHFIHVHTHETGAGARYAQQCALLLMRDLVRHAAGPDWQPKVVLSTDAARSARIIEVAFGGAAARQAPFNGFVFPRTYMSLPLQPRQNGGAGPGTLDRQDFGASAPSSDFVGSIRQIIATLMPFHQTRVTDVAGAAGMTRRTLQRRLAEAGEDYSELLARIRYEAGVRLLEDRSLSLIDVAYTLGYTRPENFSRAFRRWTGVAPVVYRRMRLDPERQLRKSRSEEP